MFALELLLPRHARRRARVEIIPLIDVIFFLLATFVLFTLSLTRIVSLPANLPTSTEISTEALTLRVSDRGTLYWDNELITLAELSPRLADLKRVEPTRRIMIASDPGALLGDATAVLDTIRGADFEQVAIDTRPPTFAR